MATEKLFQTFPLNCFDAAQREAPNNLRPKIVKQQEKTNKVSITDFESDVRFS